MVKVCIVKLEVELDEVEVECDVILVRVDELEVKFGDVELLMLCSRESVLKFVVFEMKFGEVEVKFVEVFEVLCVEV
jgi:hypothetical protein